MTESQPVPTEPVRVEVFLRMHTSADVVERLRNLIARVRALEGNGVVTTVDVKTWSPVRPALEELSDSGPSVALTVNAFEAWADREGYSLQPAFVRRETTSMLSRHPTAEIHIPIVSLAVYKDDALHCVIPCKDDDQTYTVEDCLTALEAGLSTPFERAKPQLQDQSERTADK